MCLHWEKILGNIYQAQGENVRTCQLFGTALQALSATLYLSNAQVLSWCRKELHPPSQVFLRLWTTFPSGHYIQSYFEWKVCRRPAWRPKLRLAFQSWPGIHWSSWSQLWVVWVRGSLLIDGMESKACELSQSGSGLWKAVQVPTTFPNVHCTQATSSLHAGPFRTTREVLRQSLQNIPCLEGAPESGKWV